MSIACLPVHEHSSARQGVEEEGKGPGWGGAREIADEYRLPTGMYTYTPAHIRVGRGSGRGQGDCRWFHLPTSDTPLHGRSPCLH